MKCILDGQNAGILAKAIHSFSRIGCELYLEVDSHSGLSLRTVNMTKSAFASISFNRDFFSSFSVKSKNIEDNQCKLSMKSCVGVFRNMKQVESCTISLNSESYKLIVQFRCRLETLRTHHISILEHETLQASYFTDRSLNAIGGNHKLFSNIITNFKTNEEELSIKASDKDVVVQNYADGTHVDNRFVRSQITIKPEEFEKYKIGESTTITFCMRELRAILNFAESMNINITANFDTAGKPIVFVIKDFDTFEANLVMSTLSPEDTELECQQSRSAAQANLQNSTTDNIVLDKTNVDGDVDGDVNGDAADKELTSHDEDEPNNGVVNTKKRNHLFASFSDAFESNSSKCTSLDVVVRTKKRRTSNEHRRNTHLPSANGTHATNRTEKSPPPMAQIDLDSENIDVVFQESSSELNTDPPLINHGIESMDTDMESNNNVLQHNGNVRDHRPHMRQVFRRCFTQSGPPGIDLFGATLVADSDEE